MTCSSTSRPEDELSLESVEYTALDMAEATDKRVAAIGSLYRMDKSLTKVALLQIAARDNEPIELLHFAGEQLARIGHEDVNVSEFDIRDMSKIAFEAFFAWTPPKD